MTGTRHSTVEAAGHARLDTTAGVAHRLAAALAPFVGGDLPVRLRAWDGSEAGSRRRPARRAAPRRTPCAGCCWHPGELGAAQAYVTGELDVPEVDGWTLDSALTYVFAVARERGLAGGRPSPAALLGAVRTALDLGALGQPARRRPPRRPASAAGCTASCATGARSATTTTSPTSSTR